MNTEDFVKTFGKEPLNSSGEALITTEYDTILIPPSGTPTTAASAANRATLAASYNLFDPNDNKHAMLRTRSFPIPKGSVLEILGIQISHNLRFADPSQLWVFEQCSLLRFSIGTHTFPDMPIFPFLNYSRIPFAGRSSNIVNGTMTNYVSGFDQLNVATAKLGTWQTLLDSFKMPELGDIHIQFVPGGYGLLTDDIATSGTDTGFGTKFGSGVVPTTLTGTADPRVGVIRVEALCAQTTSKV